MRKRLSLLLTLLPVCASANPGKLALDYGYFSINAKAGGKSTSVANPSALRLGYLMGVHRKVDLNFSYSVLLADFSGSDLGYGADIGANFFPFTDARDRIYEDDKFSARVSETWRPYVGLAFHQRNFQSVKNSYAGFGASLGSEYTINEDFNLRGEGRMIQLAGSGESEATEIGAFLGVVMKL